MMRCWFVPGPLFGGGTKDGVEEELLDPPEDPDPPLEPPGMVMVTETCDPVPMRLVAPTVTDTLEPAVNPDREQTVSVAETNVQERLTEYAVTAAPPSSIGALQDTTAVVFERALTLRDDGEAGTVAGTPRAVAVLEESSEPFALDTVTSFTSYAVPLVSPVNV